MDISVLRRCRPPIYHRLSQCGRDTIARIGASTYKGDRAFEIRSIGPPSSGHHTGVFPLTAA
jgi:hypothetical protein